MKTHELKCWPEFFYPITIGAKQFEYRKNDRGFEVGDLLYLREFEPSRDTTWKEGGRYTGASCRRVVTYVLLGPAAGVPEGYCVMSIEHVPGL